MIERFIDRSKALLSKDKGTRSVFRNFNSYRNGVSCRTHRFDSLLVTLSGLYSVVSGLPSFPDQLIRLQLDLREFLLDEIQCSVRVAIDTFEGKTGLEELEAVEDRGREGGDSVVERGSVGVIDDVTVCSVEGVFHYGVVVCL